MPTIVVADDSPTLRRIVSTVLEREDFTVETATDGVEAVQAVLRTQPAAVILDVQMPRVSGYVAARLIKDDPRTAHIPVVLLTSLDAASDRYWGASAGADRYLTKDFEAPELVAAVREVIATSAPARPDTPADPAEVSVDDVLGRVCDLLDRRLFEASVSAEVTAIAAEAQGFEEAVARLLDVVGKVVDYDLASILMLDERTAYLAVARETSPAQHAEFFGALADAATHVSGSPVTAAELVSRVMDPHGLLDAEDEGRMATFVSLPLRAAGRPIGVLALSSATASAFGDAAVHTLRLIEAPAAVVVANARAAALATTA